LKWKCKACNKATTREPDPLVRVRLAKGDEERGNAHHRSQHISSGNGLCLIVLNVYDDLLCPVWNFRKGEEETKKFITIRIRS
jgi:hypothetical protein